MAQQTLRDYLQATEDAISSGRINDAHANCQYILTHFPESLEAQRLLGEVYLAQGHLDEAQQTFDWILTNDPENVIVYCDRALICENTSDYDTALDCYQQAYELSRGNSQIRQEFNALSAKIGQQGFIFSRAGLARLYMRGDLLPQAMQEWETVLTISPDRLDARVGLLETCWREGLYDRVERLATEILNSVPVCLKALLLLAHVTYPQNIQQAQELLKRAEALDPDLVMAQELFADLMASQPNDPFLALLQKPPTVLSEELDGQLATSATASGNGKSDTNSPLATPTFSESLQRWSSLDNIIEPLQDYQTMQEATPLTTWSGNATSEIDSWSGPGEQDYQPSQEEVPSPVPQPGNSIPDAEEWSPLGQPAGTWYQNEPKPETQSTEQEVNNTITEAGTDDHPLLEQQLWHNMDHFSEANAEPVEQWNSVSNFKQVSPTAPWDAQAQEDDTPAPPAWLDMLTRGERRQSSGDLPIHATPPQGEQEPPPLMPPAQQAEQAAEPLFSTPMAWEENLNTISPLPQEEDESPFFFGPEWLKSLGAASIDSTPSSETPPPAPSEVPEPPVVSTPHEVPMSWAAISPVVYEPPAAQTPSTAVPPVVSEPATVPPLPLAQPGGSPPLSSTPAAFPEVPDPKQKTPVKSWIDEAAQRLAQPDQNILTTLEELEKDLRSQGFTPLEPGSLSTIAQEEPTLSSALAQLGNFESQPTNMVPPAMPAQPATTPVVPPLEPLWPATPGPVSQVPPTPELNTSPEPEPADKPSHMDTLSKLIGQPAPVPAVSAPSEHAQADTIISPVSNDVPEMTPAPAPTLSARPDALLDIELEKTMKRPALRLQSIQQRSSPQQKQPGLKGRVGERTPASKTTDGNVNYKERLLKGYQDQLAGSYDEAMQEYRVIIRNAPELLGDVVSNMRALLKLAPKYSAGYRVLGDAYMRQGEYLQAMEAYNKALTMVKKAKS